MKMAYVQPVVSDIGDYAHVDDLHELLTQRFSYEYDGQWFRNYTVEVSTVKGRLTFECL